MKAQHWFTCGVGHDMDGPFTGLRDALQHWGRKSARFLFGGAYQLIDHTEGHKSTIYIFTKAAATRLGFDVKECDWLQED